MKYILLCIGILFSHSLFPTKGYLHPLEFEMLWKSKNFFALRAYMMHEYTRVYKNRPEQCQFFIWHHQENKKIYSFVNNMPLYLSLDQYFLESKGLFLHTLPFAYGEKKAIIINHKCAPSDFPIKYYFDGILHHELVHLEQSNDKSLYILSQESPEKEYAVRQKREHEADIKSGKRVFNPYAHLKFLEHSQKNIPRSSEYASWETLLNLQNNLLEHISKKNPALYQMYKDEWSTSLKQ